MNQCVLVDSGNCPWAIVSPSRQKPGIEWAMAEFQKYLGEMSGCKLVFEDPARGGKQIVIGLRKDLTDGDAASLPPRAEGFDGYPPGFEFALDNTLEEQKQWDVQAFQWMRQSGFVRLAFLWNLDFAQKDGLGPEDPNAPYSVLDFRGVARPAFGAIGAMEKP